MNRKSKIIIASIITAMIIAGGIFVFVFSRGIFGVKPVEQKTDLAASIENFNIDPRDQLNYKNEVIPLLWTDNNDNENLIIKSDRQYYDGRDSSEVYFSITNISDKDQKPDIKFLFKEKEGRGMKELALLNSQNDVIAVGQTNYYKAVIYYPQNSNGEFFIEAKGDNGGYGLLDPYYASGLVGNWTFNGPDMDNTTNTAYDRSGQGNNGEVVGVTSGLVGWWKLDDGSGTTASDSSGNGNTGSFGGSGNSWTSGQINGALSFNGSGYLGAGNGSSLQFNGDMTVSLWVKTTGLNSSNQTFFAYKSDWSSNTGWYLMDDGQWGAYVIFRVMGSGSYYDVSFARSLVNDGTWHLITGVRSGTTISIYLDNEFIASTGSTNFDTNTNANLYMGDSYTGDLDDTRVYNRALTQAEITELYNGSSKVVPGISGQALNFDGTDDYVNLGNPASLNLNTNFTISAWAKINSFIGLSGIVAKGPSTGGGTIVIRADGPSSANCATGKCIVFRITDNTNNAEDAVDAVENTWYHVVMVVGSRGAGGLLGYVNGVGVVNVDTSTVGTITTSSNWNVGYNERNDVYFPGLIDEVRIYNRALSASEITDLYRIGAARMKVNTPITQRGAQSGLVGNWSFNGPDTTWTSATAGTTADKSGNGNTGTMTNMSRGTSPAPGISGQALSFDGTDDRVDTTNFMSSGVTAFTLQAWVFKTATKDARIVYKNNAGNTSHPVFGLASGGTDQIRCRLRISDSSGTDFSASTISLNTWTFVACTYDGSNVRVYKNGAEVDSIAETGTLAATNDVVVIGQNETGTSVDRHWPGLIDEVRVYNRALSASEVQDLYRIGAARMKVNTPITQRGAQSGLVGNWSFNGPDTTWTSATAGTTADKSGNGNTGTMTNMSRGTSPAPGISGQAIDFDGSNDYVEVPYSANLNNITTGITFSAWLKPSSGSLSSRRDIIQRWYDGNVWWFKLDNLGKLSFYAPNITGGVYKESTNAISEGVWTYGVITYDDATDIRFYINGQLDNTITASGSFLTSTSGIWIGINGYDLSTPFNGLIDELRIYNRALSQSEITDLYKAGARRMKIKQ